MYSEESISSLINRIGWEVPLDSDSSIILDTENKTADSGRKVNAFHQLASVENIYAAVAEVDMDMADFNKFLASIREQSVREVLTVIFDQHHLYIDTTDYSSIIAKKVKLFDSAIGYTIAVKILELFVSSNRKNFIERNASLSFQTLKIELYGAKNDNGHFIAKGITYEKNEAIKKAQKILFPDPVLIDGTPLW
ncbi:MAG: hypothetical protein KGZ87_05335 [Bacteroidetes bacterium]|nr:hypothetical protein [Bacteroidota bacterium]